MMVSTESFQPIPRSGLVGPYSRVLLLTFWGNLPAAFVGATLICTITCNNQGRNLPGGKQAAYYRGERKHWDPYMH